MLGLHRAVVGDVVAPVGVRRDRDRAQPDRRRHRATRGGRGASTMPRRSPTPSPFESANEQRIDLVEHARLPPRLRSVRHGRQSSRCEPIDSPAVPSTPSDARRGAARRRRHLPPARATSTCSGACTRRLPRRRPAPRPRPLLGSGRLALRPRSRGGRLGLRGRRGQRGGISRGRPGGALIAAPVRPSVRKRREDLRRGGVLVGHCEISEMLS